MSRYELAPYVKLNTENVRIYTTQDYKELQTALNEALKNSTISYDGEITLDLIEVTKQKIEI